MELKSQNPNSLKVLLGRLEQLSSKQGKVGWFETSIYPDGTPVAQVAAWNEFGVPSRSIPPRPFMRPAVIQNETLWKEMAAAGAKQILKGSATPDDVMEKLTLAAQNEISQNIATLVSPPLSPITLGVRKYKKDGKTVTGATIGEIARKLDEGTLDVSGVSTKPLEDTGLMSATLTHVVEDATS